MFVTVTITRGFLILGNRIDELTWGGGLVDKGVGRKISKGGQRKKIRKIALLSRDVEAEAGGGSG